MTAFRPLILITNDDGIHSPGLMALVEALAEDYDLLVSAPWHQQTNMGRGALKGEDVGAIRTYEMTVEGRQMPAFAVHGSPAQAVAHGLLELCDRMPDLCVSGINYGENLGLAFTCSGTLGACFEAHSFGIPGIAFSRQVPLENQRSHEFQKLLWDAEKNMVKRIVKNVLVNGFPENTGILNVNFPHGMTETTEIRMTVQANMNFGTYIKPEERDLTRGYQLGWQKNAYVHLAEPETDVHAIHKLGVVSATLLSPLMSVGVKKYKL